MSEPFLGQIKIFAGNFAPLGWALCDGQLLPIATYSALFSIMGTTYGGDGRTTFALPDLRSRAAKHAGNGPGLSNAPLGSFTGQETTTLTTNNLPSHTHTTAVNNTLKMRASDSSADTDDPDGAVMGAGTSIYHNTADEEMGATALGGNIAVTNQNTGNGVSFSNQQPYLAMHYIIAIEGTFPSKNFSGYGKTNSRKKQTDQKQPK